LGSLAIRSQRDVPGFRRARPLSSPSMLSLESMAEKLAGPEACEVVIAPGVLSQLFLGGRKRVCRELLPQTMALRVDVSRPEENDNEAVLRVPALSVQRSPTYFPETPEFPASSPSETEETYGSHEGGHRATYRGAKFPDQESEEGHESGEFSAARPPRWSLTEQTGSSLIRCSPPGWLQTQDVPMGLSHFGTVEWSAS
jgi:hypothetical protein